MLKTRPISFLITALRTMRTYNAGMLSKYAGTMPERCRNNTCNYHVIGAYILRAFISGASDFCLPVWIDLNSFCRCRNSTNFGPLAQRINLYGVVCVSIFNKKLAIRNRGLRWQKYRKFSFWKSNLSISYIPCYIKITFFTIIANGLFYFF